MQIATKAVTERRLGHLPVWQMHAGAQKWLALLSKQCNITHLIEFDVEDCFLNTPRQLLLTALHFWLDLAFVRRHTTQCFAISKDGKSDNYVGRPCSIRYWAIEAAVVVAAVKWELQHNSLFEVLGETASLLCCSRIRVCPLGVTFLPHSLSLLLCTVGTRSLGHCCRKAPSR